MSTPNKRKSKEPKVRRPKPTGHALFAGDADNWSQMPMYDCDAPYPKTVTKKKGKKP